MAARIHVEISGSSKDLQQAALAAVSSIRGVRAEVKRSETTTRSATRENAKLGASIRGVSRDVHLFGNALKVLKLPALIASLGFAAQAVSALSAGVIGLTSALAPLSGLLVAYPAALGAAAQAMGVWKLAAGDLEKALGGDEKALKSLTPEARKFAGTLKALQPQLRELRSAAGKGLFAGLDRGLNSALKNFDVLKTIVRDTGGALGVVAAQAGKLVGSKAFGADLAAIGKTNATTIERLGKAGINLGDSLRHVMVAAGPFINWLSSSALSLSRLVDREAAAARESGRLAHFFGETRKTLELLAPTVRDTAAGLFNIGKAAKPFGDEMLASLGKASKGFREWTASTEGQRSLAAYFERARQPLRETVLLVRDLGAAFLRLSTGEGVGPLIRQVRVQLVPALEQLVGSMTAAFGPKMTELAVSLVKTLAVLSGPTGALTVLADTLRLASDALRTLLQTPGLGNFATNMITVAAVWKGLKWSGAIAAAKTLSTQWTRIRTAAAGTAAASVAAGAGAGGGAAAGAAGTAKAVAGGAAGGAAGGLFARLGGARLAGGTIGTLLVANMAVDSLKAPEGKRTGGYGLPQKTLLTDSEKRSGRTLEPEVQKGRNALATFGREIDSLKGRLDRLTPKKLAELRAEAERLSHTRGTEPWRAALGRLQRDLERTKGLGLQMPNAFERAARQLTVNLRSIATAGKTNLGDLRSAVGVSMADIRRDFGVHSREAARAMQVNFRGAMRSLRSLLNAGKVDSKTYLGEIARLARVHSKGSRDSIARNFAGAVRAIRAAMADGKVATSEGLGLIKKLMLEELRLYGFSGKDAGKLFKAGVTAGDVQKGQGISGALGRGPQGLPGTQGKARGGMVQYGRPGDSGRDSIPTNIGGQDVVVAPGEVAAVFNRHQLPVLNARLADLGGLPGLFKKVDTPHHMASGGLQPGISRLAGAVTGRFPGLSITSTTGGQHAAGSYHYRGQAADIGGPAGLMNQAAAWVRSRYGKSLAEGIHNPNLSIKDGKSVSPGFWGSTTWANHANHIHLAIAGALKALGIAGGAEGGAVAAQLKRVLIGGPDGPLKSIAQRAVDKVRAGAQKKLNDLAAQSGAVSAPDGPAGAGTRGPGSLSRAQIKALWIRAGGPPGVADQMANIAWSESRWNPSARNPSGASGLWQILGNPFPGDPMDPLTNARMAVAKYRAGGLRPWDASKAVWSQRNSAPAHARGGLVGGDGVSIADFLPAAKGVQLKGGGRKPRAILKPHRKGRRFKPLMGPRQIRGGRVAGQPSAESVFDTLGRFVEDQDSLYTSDERDFQLDDVLSEDELNKLLGRAGGIRGAIAKQLELLGKQIVPGDRQALDTARTEIAAHVKKIKQQVARVKALVRRVREIRAELARIGRKKNPTQADRAHAGRLRQEGNRVHADLAALTGDPMPNVHNLGSVTKGTLGREQTALGKVRERVPDLEQKLATDTDELRPSQLPASLRDWDFKIAELRKNGATKPEAPAESGEVAALLREHLTNTQRALRVSQAQFSVLQGIGPLVGRYAHGTDFVQKTGLAMVHRGEEIRPDRQGPYGSQLVQGRGDVKVDVHIHGDTGPLIRKVDVLVDGKIQKYERDLRLRAGQRRNAPGR